MPLIKEKQNIVQLVDPIFSHIAQLDIGLRKKVLDAIAAEHLAPENSVEFSYTLWINITFIRSILAHPNYPNRVTSESPAQVPSEDDAAIIKEDITAYIHHLIQQTSTQLDKNNGVISPANSSPIKVIFLDIDGVLLNGGWGNDNKAAYEAQRAYVKEKLGSKADELDLYDIGATLRFNKEAIERLRALCVHNNAKIVISSSWRDEETTEKSMDKLKSLFKLWDLDAFIIGVTPTSYEDRAHEIQQWLDENQNVESFVILDDVDDKLSKTFGTRFIDTSNTLCFSQEHYEQAMGLFQGKSSAIAEKEITENTAQFTSKPVVQITPVESVSPNAHVPLLEQFQKEMDVFKSEVKQLNPRDDIWLPEQQMGYFNHTRTELGKKLYLLTKNFLITYKDKLTATEKGVVFKAYLSAWSQGECKLKIENTEYAQTYKESSFGKYISSYNERCPMTAGFDLSGVCLDFYSPDLIFVDVNLNGADLSKAQFPYAHFENCSMNNLKTTSATNLHQSRFVKCSMNSNDLRTVGLDQASIYHCSIIDTQLKQSVYTSQCISTPASPIVEEPIVSPVLLSNSADIKTVAHSEATEIPPLKPTLHRFFKAPIADPIKVIFLDIDGVLLKDGWGDDNEKAYQKNLAYIKEKLGSKADALSLYDIGATLRFNKDAVNHLKALCEKNNAKIVISSHWRVCNNKEKSMEKLTSLFKLWDLDTFIIDVTPTTYKSRAHEIQQWLDENQNVESFVILDDVDSGLSKAFGEQFVNTSKTMYFSQEHYVQATNILSQTIKQSIDCPSV
jgi:hypothetical protein